MQSLISHHLLLCASPKKALCCQDQQGNQTWERLKDLLKELNLEDPERREGVVLRSKVDCLRICKEGPILLIWPEGMWYQKVSPDRIEAIIKSHVINGEPIKEWILKITPLHISADKFT